MANNNLTQVSSTNIQANRENSPTRKRPITKVGSYDHKPSKRSAAIVSSSLKLNVSDEPCVVLQEVKYDDGKINDCTNNIRERRFSVAKTEAMCVSFNETVSVVEILSHRDYSDSIRQRMWSSSEEIIENAKRNAIEYIADGRDWRKVAEEDSMWSNCETGELIHPAHIPQRVVQFYQEKFQVQTDNSQLIDYGGKQPRTDKDVAPEIVKQIEKLDKSHGQVKAIERGQTEVCQSAAMTVEMALAASVAASQNETNQVKTLPNIFPVLSVTKDANCEQ